jgi:hypothetical protein
MTFVMLAAILFGWLQLSQKDNQASGAHAARWGAAAFGSKAAGFDLLFLIRIIGVI